MHICVSLTLSWFPAQHSHFHLRANVSISSDLIHVTADKMWPWLVNITIMFSQVHGMNPPSVHPISMLSENYYG